MFCHLNDKEFFSYFPDGICLDTAHLVMACNSAKGNQKEWFRELLPFTGHLHIADAIGIDGEGVQIGKGDVDFVQLYKNLDELAPESAFIPEVWQGHKQNGSGFWKALEFLEKYF